MNENEYEVNVNQDISMAEQNRNLSERNAADGYRFENNQGGGESRDGFDDLKTSPFYNESYKKPAKGKLKGLIAPLLIVALISSVLTGGIVASYFTFISPPAPVSDARQDSGSVTPPTPALVRQVEIVNNAESPIVAIAELVGPSIVGVSVDYVYNDMWFGQQKGHGEGSGIIYRSDGYIITNNHVIESAMEGSTGNKMSKGSSIRVILPNQTDKPIEATVVGRDRKTDIAVLKIEASELPAAAFGDSDEVKVGELAIAIGNPAGQELMGSVTSGIISGLNRKITFDDRTSMRLIQTDAAINPGNSGGALLNGRGEVIGVNSSKIIGSNYEGLGFAIPSNVAKSVADTLIDKGYVVGPWLGVEIATNFNKEIADRNGVPHGVLVSDVIPLSGAFRAGIKPGDIITKFNGVPVTSFDELEEEKNKYKPGDTVTIELYRMPEQGDPKDGSYKTVEVVLGEYKG
jgi:serine protease Do